MKITGILSFAVLLVTSAFAQEKNGYFEMNSDLDDGTISYRDTISADTLKAEEIYSILIDYLESDAVKSKEISGADDNQIKKELTFQTVGQKSDLGAAYDYRFSCVLTIDIKDSRLRYTFSEFKKKSSPGEPGMSMEAYIDSYKPKVSSTRSRDRYASRLDEIELSLHEQVSDIIYKMRKKLQKEEDEW